MARTACYFRHALLARYPERDQLFVAWGFVAAGLWASVTLAAGDALPLPAPLFFGLTALLAAIAAIDARWGLIPDELLLCIAIGGMVYALCERPASAWIGIAGGAGTVLALGGALRAFAASRLGREALGLGDVKLLCVAVSIVGLGGLLLTIPVALGSALASLALGRLGAGSEAPDAIPLGPHLGLALLWTVLLGTTA